MTLTLDHEVMLVYQRKYENGEWRMIDGQNAMQELITYNMKM